MKKKKKVILIKNRAGFENKMLREKYIAQIPQNCRRFFISADFLCLRKFFFVFD